MRSLIAVCGSVALAVASVAFAQGDYPAKPIRLLAPLAAGSAADAAARVLAERMSRNMRQPIVVETVPGAGGLAGATQVAKSAPDGYTLGAFDDRIMTMLPNLHARMPWNALEDFEPVSLVGTLAWGLVAGNGAPYASAADLIAAATAAPGRIRYASGGTGSAQHLAMALFASMAGITLAHAPFPDAAQAAQIVAAGRVPVGFQEIAAVAGAVRDGKLRLVAVASPRRHPKFPDVPTVAESGLPGYAFDSWLAIVAPARTPKDILVRLHAEIDRALAAADVREKLVQQGFTLRGSSPEELGAATRVRLARYARLVKEAGIRAE